MTYTFRPAVRENTPLIIGLAGPTKSGKTYSAHRLARGLAPSGSTIAMINAEGPRGHQYADEFKYVACDLVPPYRPMAYTDALAAAAALKPGVVIIDSGSHMHDGPGGILDWHEEELDRMAGNDYAKREKSTFAAWVKPKAAENEFIYAMLSMACPVILCFRAKEKIRISKGKVEELGWQPIAGERVAFETIFTLMLPPHSAGVPDLKISDMRTPFDTMVPPGKPIDENLGRELAKWSTGAKAAPAPTPRPVPPPPPPPPPVVDPQVPARTPEDVARTERELFGDSEEERERAATVRQIYETRDALERKPDAATWAILTGAYAGTEDLERADLARLADFLAILRKVKDKDPATIQSVNATVKAARERKA